MRRALRPTLHALLLACATGSAAAREPSDSAALDAFLDGIMRADMARLEIPAAVAVVVKGERVLLARGWGLADRAKGTPVDPATSMFHIGSTGKLFTWTAVMQLVERGRLDLDADVNTYLAPYRIPATFPEPITLRHLLTHTAGFEEGVLGYYIGDDTTDISTIEELVTAHTPTRVRPPGRVAAYSNFGASLAGFIIERVSGLPYETYIEREILAPLEMKRTTFREPIPAALRPDAVRGYRRVDGAWVEQSFEINGGFVPAGGVVASGLDVAAFMIAHLNGGGYRGARILRPETAALMHRRAFTHDARLPGMALGFVEERINGRRVIGHGGDSKDFHVDLLLVPEDTVGLFVGYAGAGGAEAREGLRTAFFDRYYPDAGSGSGSGSSSGSGSGGAGRALSEYVGVYRFVRMNYTDLEKSVYLLALPHVRVTVAGAGRLRVDPGMAGAPRQYAPAGPDLFREVGGDGEIAFGTDEGGRVSRVFFGAYPTMATERVPWHERRSFLIAVSLLSLVVLLSILPVAACRRGNRAPPRGQRLATWLAVGAVAWLLLTGLAAVAVVASHGASIMAAIPPALYVVLAMPVAFVGLALGLVAAAVAAWRGRYWGRAARVHYTLVALAALALAWFFLQTNILGWQLG